MTGKKPEGRRVTRRNASGTYLRVAADLRAKIASGEIQVGDPIPTTAELMKMYDVSTTVVQRAIAVLIYDDAILASQRGEAIWVIAKPES